MRTPMVISPFAPKDMPTINLVKGMRLVAVEAGIKYQGRKDLMLAVFLEGTVIAGILTKSKTCSAPVVWCRAQLKHGFARALVVNSGNANAFTGFLGDEAVRLITKAAADAVGCSQHEVYLASTGVIGEPLQAQTFTHLFDTMVKNASVGKDAWHDAARSIMTTDTYPKIASTSVMINGVYVSISGVVKGAGMIAPDMATMLAFIFTDASIDSSLLQSITNEISTKTFNCITVDGDTSTSDTLLIFATGACNHDKITDPDSSSALAFKSALYKIMHDLALQVVKDGEGISKFITIHITGAENDMAAHRIGMSLANSPLLKIAISGEDANWGRVVMAVGKAGEAANRDNIKISFGPNLLAEKGMRSPSYDEEIVSTYMKNSEIDISVDVGVGFGKATVWTCDLTHDYIKINSDYRT
ncbi:MAG: bifunctional glutamate N-acetyltransferase/amino-acid acetyltransferase ArgJ [Hyphomicrobiaceae bacterium]|nr:bifunctional glutamate N-acetyltransferase/amino-acid acetyltransferase ArgJ [Hyphomicrobiaceae bacterium]